MAGAALHPSPDDPGHVHPHLTFTGQLPQHQAVHLHMNGWAPPPIGFRHLTGVHWKTLWAGRGGGGAASGTKPQEVHYEGKGMRSGTEDAAEAVKWEVSGSIGDCDQAEIGSVWLWVWRWSPTFSGGKSLPVSCLQTFLLAASVAAGRSCCWTGPSRHWNSSPPTAGTKLLCIVPDLFSNLALMIARCLCLLNPCCALFPVRTSLCPPETHSRISDWRVLFQNRRRCWSEGRSLARTC